MVLGQGKLSRLLLSSSEVRTDVYISCTEGVGLKLRGSKELMEVKVRGDKHPSGAEQWSKVCSTRCYPVNNGFHLLCQLVQKHVRARNQEEIKALFQKELQAILKSHHSKDHHCSLGMQVDHGA